VSLPLRSEFDVLSAHRFAHVARDRKVDVVHVHKGVAHAVALGATFMGAHYGLVVNRGVSFPMDFFSRLKYRSRRVSRVVCVAESVRRVVIATGRVPAHKVGVIYAGVDLERFDPARTHPEVVRTELGIPAEASVVGHVGMRDWKGWKEVLTAFPAVRADHASAHLLLVACRSEAQSEGVLELAREMGLNGAVTATMERRDMPDVLAACDLVVDSSWAGTGITGTLREAMALGKPVVATSRSRSSSRTVLGNPGSATRCADSRRGDLADPSRHGVGHSPRRLRPGAGAKGVLRSGARGAPRGTVPPGGSRDPTEATAPSLVGQASPHAL
jgi:glycosyltransferase involved in cell wall biosynthesis